MASSPITIDSRPQQVPAGTAAEDVVGTNVTGLRTIADGASLADVERAVNRPAPGDLTNFAALLSPLAGQRLEDLAKVSHRTTIQRFGRTVRLYAPLYLSNECVSVCSYCGFSAGNSVTRRTLSVEQVEGEGAELRRRGFRHILLVAGEHARIVSKDYLVDCVRALAPLMPSISLEVQVWDTATYRRLVEAGCDGLTVFQETYDVDTYGTVHLKGKKRNYAWRLGAPDRGAEAGMRKLTIGTLLGLHADWRSDAIALAAHARALMKRWWRCEVTVALPRLRPAAGGFTPEDPVGDREFVQLLCALRITFPDIGINLSTREPPALRDALLRLGVTTMSAGSHTEPGGYASDSDAEPQFEIADSRSPAEVAAVLRASGYEPVWKDWIRS